MADNYMEPTSAQIEHGGKAKEAFNEAASPSPPQHTATNDGPPPPPNAAVQQDKQTQPFPSLEMRGPDGDRMREAVRQNNRDKGQREKTQEAAPAKDYKIVLKDSRAVRAMVADAARREAEKSLNLENESDKGR